MIFVLTALDETSQAREFIVESDRLEDGLDWLSQLAGRGSTLLTARVIDRDSLTVLPVAVFDGSPFTAAIQRLAAEWRAILAQPPLSQGYTDEQANRLLKRQFDNWEAQILRQEQLMNRLRSLADRVGELKVAPAQQQSLREHCQSMLCTGQQHLSTAYRWRERYRHWANLTYP